MPLPVALALALGLVLSSMVAFARPCFAALPLADAPRFIGEELEEWEDTSGRASAAEALAPGVLRRTSLLQPNHGCTRSAFFYRFSLQNSTLDRRVYVLDVARAWVTEVDLHRVSAGITELLAHSDARVPRARREVPTEEPAFAIELDPGESGTYLLRLAGPGPIALRGEISPRSAFFEKYTRGVLLWGGVYGVLLGIAIYTAIVFTILRDPQWWLVALLLSGVLTEAMAHGHLARLFPSVTPYVELRCLPFSVALAILSFCKWSRVVLRTRLAPRIDRVIRIGEVAGGSLCLLAGLDLHWMALAFAGPILTATSVMVASVLRWRNGHAPARPFVIAAAALLVPGSIACATGLGYVPVHPLTEHGDYVGVVVMSVLLALGASQEMLATRSDLERKNRAVTALAEDLRDQVVQRSRELRRVLELRGRSEDASPLELGTVFDDRYRVVRLLGEGGMGAVYEVSRTRDDRRLALKVMTRATGTTAALRLSREAEIGAKLRHPNLVSIVDVGLRDDRMPFLVMDLVLGGSLEDHRARYGDVAWARGTLRDIVAGLRALHDAGIVHRDLKPSNILMEEGVARICDFGIATHSGPEEADVRASDAGPRPARHLDADPHLPSRLTTTGSLIGTPLYMAPEAVAKATLTPAADIFAFGLIAFELLTGEFPLALFAEPLATSTAVARPTLAHVPGLTSAVRMALEACTAMAPASRPTAFELEALLRESSSAATSAA